MGFCALHLSSCIILPCIIYTAGNLLALNQQTKDFTSSAHMEGFVLVFVLMLNIMIRVYVTGINS